MLRGIQSKIGQATSGVQTAFQQVRQKLTPSPKGVNQNEAVQQTTAKTQNSPVPKQQLASIARNTQEVVQGQSSTLRNQRTADLTNSPGRARRASMAVANFFRGSRPARTGSAAARSAGEASSEPRSQTFKRKVRSSWTQATTFASGLQSQLLNATAGSKKAKVPEDLKEMKTSLDPILKNTVDIAKSSWGEQRVKNPDEGKREETPHIMVAASPPNQESQKARQTDDKDDLHAIGNDIEVSIQTHKDYARPMAIDIRTGSGEDKSLSANGYGVTNGIWDQQGNKLQDIFQEVGSAIRSTPEGENLTDEQVNELIHTALEGSTQTFDAILTNPINSAVLRNEQSFVGNGTPTVSIEARDGALYVTRNQPMQIKRIGPMDTIPVDMERTFKIDIQSGECSPTDASINVHWDQRKAL